MTNKEPHEIKLPQFVIDSELSRVLMRQLPDYLSRTSDKIVFDWSDVCFFDDYTLLKLTFLQIQMRSLENRVSNKGFITAENHAVLRQLWMVGLPELIASNNLFGSEHLKRTLEDETELLESDPFRGLLTPTDGTAVIPMLCCHDSKHFAAGSREEKQLDSFIRTCLRPLNQKFLSWDLVENCDFRHRMLEQLRRNVQEHSRQETRGAIGLAIVRVWTSRSLSDEWGLTDVTSTQLLRLWSQEPVQPIFQKLGTNHGILQISVLDDGVGIPDRLNAVHEELLDKFRQHELFHERLHYSNVEFDKRFAGPASWSDKKARLIAFAMDVLGTSKPDRAKEIKGLEYLRNCVTIEMGGAVCIESDGAAISNITRNQNYGQPQQLRLTWCKTGGTGVCLAVPMAPVDSIVYTRKQIPKIAEFGVSAYTGTGTKRIIVKNHLIFQHTNNKYSKSKPSNFENCINTIIAAIELDESQDDFTLLRREGLVIIDWGELPDSKRVFHNLMVEIAQRLAAIEPLRLRPFVYANLPKGLCGLLTSAIKKYSKHDIPICVFTGEQIEPFWLGLDAENIITEELRSQISCEIRGKLTDHKENRTEAFYRDCLTELLSVSKPVSLSDASILHSVRYEKREAVQQSLVFSGLKTLIKRCSLFREEQKSVSGEMVCTDRFQPVFRIDEITAEVRALFLDQFREVFTKPPVCFIPQNKKDGIILPHSKRVTKRYFRSDALVDSSIAMELTQELTAIALSIARQTPECHIDWVVSCTSPPHWFVHRIVDGLAEYGIHCSHHVFTSYETISDSLDEIGMRAGEIVIAFTDVISSGQTVYRMADSLISQFKVKFAGLIALADIRTPEDRKNGPDINRIYNGTVVCLYNEPEPHRKDLKPTYYVHPETVVPKRKVAEPESEFFEKNYTGTGPLVLNHTFFHSPKRTLDLITSLDALRFGHFQHGSHHSEIFVDVEKILKNRDYRNIMITAIFRYIIINDIRLVLYPSHSSAYMIADDLKQRFNSSESSLEFIMACRTFQGTQGTSYALTRFSPHSDSQWKKFSNSAILILDDAVCSGETVKSIMAELARIDSNYYDNQNPMVSQQAKSQFSIHVVAFLNRLPRVIGDFWSGLSRIVAGHVQFSTFIKIPLTASSSEICPQCRLAKRLEHLRDSESYCLYAREFLTCLNSRQNYNKDRAKTL
jgi:hypothetical protein